MITVAPFDGRDVLDVESRVPKKNGGGGNGNCRTKIRRRFLKINRLHGNPSKISRGINSKKKEEKQTIQFYK